MVKRIVMGVLLVGVIVGFFFLRTVDYRFFDIVIMAMAVIGSYEMTKMLGDKLSTARKWLILTYATLLVPVHLLCETYLGDGMTYALVLTGVAVLGNLLLTVFDYDSSFESVGYCFLGIVYPNILLLFTLGLNAIGGGTETVPLLIAVALAPMTDTFAYFVGVLFGKHKLCEKISPKKTVEGAIGGLIGGIVACVAIYFIFKPTVNVEYPVVLFAFMGLIGAVISQIGDLIESVIKRKCEVKDSGKIFMSHGGMLDRIDSISFVCWFVYLVFALVL